MIKAGVGKSNNPDAAKAGAEAAEEALEKLGEKANLVIVFSRATYDPRKVLKGVRTVFRVFNIPIIGGSPGWGAITSRGFEEGGVVVAALKFKKIKVGVRYVSDLLKDPLDAGRTLAKELKKGNQKAPKFVLVFLTGLGAAIDIFLRGLKQKLGESADVLGGGTGDEMLLKSGGYQFCDNKVLTNGAVGVGFWGDFLIGLKAEHGWEPLGLPMKITKAKGNFVYRINKKPAVKIFEQYFGEKEVRDPKFFTGQGEGILYPLGIILEKSKRIVVRQVVGVTPKGGLVFATNMPEGAKVRLMQVQTEKMIKVAAGVGEIDSQFKKKKPQLSFVFDCVTRKALLMPDHQKETDAFKKSIGDNIPVLGYYSYGEICSQKEEKEWLIHNETFSACLLAE